MKLAAYLRVSADAELERGRGLGVQKKAITRWAKANRHRVAVWTTDEAVSGADAVDTRVGLYDALEALRTGAAGGLVVYDLDCLAKALHVQEAVLGQVWEMGATVFSVEDGGEVPEDDPDDPVRRAMRQMRAASSPSWSARCCKRAYATAYAPRPSAVAMSVVVRPSDGASRASSWWRIPPSKR
jgi:DNA invertase Pin-like site-specific DNA recombinase